MSLVRRKRKDSRSITKDKNPKEIKGEENVQDRKKNAGKEDTPRRNPRAAPIDQENAVIFDLIRKLKNYHENLFPIYLALHFFLVLDYFFFPFWFCYFMMNYLAFLCSY